jgi:Zn-dependent protease with chaperone function
MYELLGICLALAACLTLNIGASLAAAALWRGLKHRAERWPAATRARLLFALRVFPPSIALICVAAILIPAYVIHEPRHTEEVISPQLAMLAALSAAGIALAAWRGWKAWRGTRRLLADWQSRAAPIRLANTVLPAYRLPHPFPIIAIVGAIRPRLFIADRIFAALSDEEIAAAIAHENGHLAARDNLKRGLLRACRDALTILPCGRTLDRAWAEAAELAADEQAARAGAKVALDLAAALVKIARLVPMDAKPTMPASALLIGDDVGGIARRVHRLTQLASLNHLPAPRPAARAGLLLAISLILGLIALIAAAPQILLSVHTALEWVVAALQ